MQLIYFTFNSTHLLIVVGLLVVFSTLRALWAVFFEMKGIINSSITTIAKLLSIEHFDIVSGLIWWSRFGGLDPFTFCFIWVSMAFLCFFACYPIYGFLYIVDDIVKDSPILRNTIGFSALAMIYPIVVLLVSPILPLLLPLAIVGIYDVMKKILFPKPLTR